MIREYTYNNKKFLTVILPKGTILFRGLHLQNTDQLQIFEDLIGTKIPGYPGYEVSSIKYVYFYPVPYVGDIISNFNTYVMYVTQYDLELLLLIKPAIMYRGDDISKDTHCNDIIVKCSNISNKTEEYKMINEDPCFTETFRVDFPNIKGYIGISHRDAEHYKLFLKRLYNKKNINKMKQIITGMLTNSTGKTGIPEIALYSRYYMNQEPIVTRLRSRYKQNLIKYAIDNIVQYRGAYNYFPLLYFNDKNIISFDQLNVFENIKILEKELIVYSNTVLNTIEITMNKFLSSQGYNINTTNYKIFLDKRTGFYTLLTKTDKKNTIINTLNDNIISYPNNDTVKKIIQENIVDIDYMTEILNYYKYSVNSEYIFDRGNSDKYLQKFTVYKAISRPDIKNKYNKNKPYN